MKSQFCAECGSALDEKGRCRNTACAKYEEGQKTKPLEFQTFKKPTNFSEKGKLIVPDCIESDQDEVPIKQYDIARLQTLIKFAFAEGRLQVTNKRVLFRSSGSSIMGPTSLQHEFSIEEIAGIELRKETRFNLFAAVALLFATVLISLICSPIFSLVYNSKFLGTVFMLLLAAASVFLFFILKNKRIARYLGMSVVLAGLPADLSGFVSTLSGSGSTLRDLSSLIVFLAFFISLMHVAFAPNFVLNIKTKGGTPSVEIRRKDSLFSFQHNEYTGFAQVLPGPDADLAMHELGALIREVQQTGTYTEN